MVFSIVLFVIDIDFMRKNKGLKRKLPLYKLHVCVYVVINL